MTSKDITGKSHWDTVYGAARPASGAHWQPRSYEELCIEKMLLRHIVEQKPTRILEVGCGNSTWLPYLARETGAAVTGIDYSEDGCRLARENLSASGVEGTIICGDIFELDPSEVGRFDFVYSLGLVEHFDAPDSIIRTLSTFLSPGGVMVTEVPNLLSIHGIMAFLYQPKLFYKHRVLSLRWLLEAYRKAGFTEIDGSRLGVFSMGIVAWGIEQRFPLLDPVILPLVRLVGRISHEVVHRLNSFRGFPLMAPFLYVVGRK